MILDFTISKTVSEQRYEKLRAEATCGHFLLGHVLRSIHSLNGSALGDGMDWMMRKMSSEVAVISLCFLPSSLTKGTWVQIVPQMDFNLSSRLLICFLSSVFTACEDPQKEPDSPIGGDDTVTKDYTETAFGMNLEMVYVEGGTFEMGATPEQDDEDSYYRDDERPVRIVKLGSYYIGKFEVTQSQRYAVMGTTLEEQLAVSEEKNGIEGEGSDYPMYYVNWEEAQTFCQKLSERTGRKYVLPTEAQWEYAARGGNKSQHYKYAGSNDVDEVAWHYYNSEGKAYPIGTKKANELGTYDMSGNVWEWCSDWYGNYDENETDNPQGPAEGELRMLRGGGCQDLATDCHVFMWECMKPEYRCRVLGFRVACLA